LRAGLRGSVAVIRLSTLKPAVSAFAMLLATMSSSRRSVICRESPTKTGFFKGLPRRPFEAGEVLELGAPRSAGRLLVP
jgi:hypothetical protein